MATKPLIKKIAYRVVVEDFYRDLYIRNLDYFGDYFTRTTARRVSAAKLDWFICGTAFGLLLSLFTFMLGYAR